MKNVLLLALAVFGFLAAPLRAQVPQILNYQGRITVGPTNFNGSGQFEFALVTTNGSTTTTYWSNDGTNGQPTNAVTLTVSNGLYSVLLGDTTIANMTAVLPLSVFTNPDVRLRVWFNDGTHGVQQLGPDQRLAASGYALMAGGVDLPVTTSATVGVLDVGGTAFLHAYGQNGLTDGNTFVGDSAGNFTLTGTNNTAVGYQALALNTGGGNNVAVGGRALKSNTVGGANVAVGLSALQQNVDGDANTAIGEDALLANSSGESNTATGHGALQYNVNGNFNTATGADALYNTTSGDNAAFGYQALFANISGSNNTAVGFQSLNNNTNGSNNISLGFQAGHNLNAGSNNIDIGSSAVANDSGVIRLGDGSTQTDTYLTGNVHLSGTSTIIGNGSGLTGITSSSLAAGSVTNTQLASGLTLGGDHQHLGRRPELAHHPFAERWDAGNLRIADSARVRSLWGRGRQCVCGHELGELHADGPVEFGAWRSHVDCRYQRR